MLNQLMKKTLTLKSGNEIIINNIDASNVEINQLIYNNYNASDKPTKDDVYKIYTQKKTKYTTGSMWIITSGIFEGEVWMCKGIEITEDDGGIIKEEAIWYPSSFLNLVDVVDGNDNK